MLKIPENFLTFLITIQTSHRDPRRTHTLIHSYRASVHMGKDDGGDKERCVHVHAYAGDFFPWSSAHVDGCIQLQRGLWIGNLALAPNGTSSPSRVKNTQEPRSPSPTLELLYEALSRLWHKDNCLPPPHTHTPLAHFLALCVLQQQI